MERLKIGGIAVVTGANAAVGAVPTWTVVTVLLTIGCVPELCRLIECIDGVIWRWKRGDHEHHRRPERRAGDGRDPGRHRRHDDD